MSYIVISLVYSLCIQLHGPFLRSLVMCSVPVVPGAFSGSAHCGDPAEVLAVAQTREGFLVSTKLVVHAAAGPLLGSLADRMGRRPVLLVGLGGYAVALLLLATAAQAHRSELLLPGFVIEGATNAFDVIYMSMLADATATADRTAAFSLYFFCSAASQVVAQVASVGILRMCLESYATVWLTLALLLLADVLFVQCAVWETLVLPAEHDGQAIISVRSLVQGPFRLVMSTHFLRIWLLSVVFTGLAAGLSAVLASFSIAAYGWRPGDLQSYTWFSNLLRMGSLSCLGPYANRVGSPPVILLVQIVGTVGASLVQIFAPFSPVVLLGPSYLVDALAFANPANAAFLSSHFSADKQARVNSVQHLCSNLSTSLSIALFSSPLLFRPGARRTAAMRPFMVAST
eukprot:CAMPEP_0168431630 /NCGR_PEP_ID=MMETSP0228-20121227/38484_1 /TAXON_ID=133427 /ORGANISM="Protoceratium reticulatum, Strain CCCM 535 (=CCMP 1889)" /LENGTH=400 /DNA_ID=CAMNT_0008445751 /DNA_START=69 /DNA_END=1267 /DNA_ORIENTATION=+